MASGNPVAGVPVTLGQVLLRVLKHFSQVLGGRVSGAILSLLAITWMVRILAPTEFGVVVLIHAGALALRGALNFRPSDAVVRFGVPLLDGGRLDDLGRLLRFTLMLDVVTALGAAGVGVLIVLMGGDALGLDGDVQAVALLYAGALVLSGSGSARGILRLFDRFDLIAVQHVLGPALRLAGVALAWWLGYGIEFLIAAGAVSVAAEYGYVNVRGWLELRRRTTGVMLRGEFRQIPRFFPGLGRFTIVVYLQSSLDVLSRHGFTLLAGAMLGPAEAGFFRLAREFAGVLVKPVVAIRQAVFPDLTRLWRDNRASFRRVCALIGLAGGGLGAVVAVVVALTGEPLVRLLLGEAYAAVAPLLILLMAAGALELAAAAFRPAGYAMGRAEEVLRVQVVVTLLHTLLFVFFIVLGGLSGAGWAAICAMLLSLGGLVLVVMRSQGLVASEGAV